MPDRDRETLSARNRDTQLTVRVPPGLKPRVRAAAGAAGETVSALVTAALERELERRDACPHRLPAGAFSKTCGETKER